MLVLAEGVVPILYGIGISFGFCGTFVGMVQDTRAGA